MAEPISASPVRMTVSVWRRLVVFQSFRQFTSFSVCVALVFAIGGLGAPMLLPGLEDKVNWPVVALLSVLIGSIPSAVGAIPSAFSVTMPPGSGTELVRRIDEGIRRFGYSELAKDAARSTYATALPEWLRWQENKITFMVMSPTLIVISGPLFPLRRLRRAVFGKGDGGL